MPQYLHPHVSTRIIDESEVFMAATGATKLFVALTSDKGPDNEIQRVTSPSEAEFLYGEPNFKTHGQEHYQMMDWLQNGGGVFALRVLPDDAKYSHAIANVMVLDKGDVVRDIEAFNNEEEYFEGDVVRFEGELYEALQDMGNVDMTPDQNVYKEVTEKQYYNLEETYNEGDIVEDDTGDLWEALTPVPEGEVPAENSFWTLRDDIIDYQDNTLYNISDEVLFNDSTVYIVQMGSASEQITPGLGWEKTDYANLAEKLGLDPDELVAEKMVLPTTAYTQTSNTSESLLEEGIKNQFPNEGEIKFPKLHLIEEDDEYDLDTPLDELPEHLTGSYEGRNYPLFAIIPMGRGEGYNNLAYRMRISDSWDETYDFRVYDFEVLRYNNAGIPEVIEGPFEVSLSPEALGLAGESLFIEEVLSEYSDYLDVIFNEDAFDDLGEEFNPEVNPSKLDFFTLEEMDVDEDRNDHESVTFFHLGRRDEAASKVTLEGDEGNGSITLEYPYVGPNGNNWSIETIISGRNTALDVEIDGEYKQIVINLATDEKGRPGDNTLLSIEESLLDALSLSDEFPVPGSEADIVTLSGDETDTFNNQDVYDFEGGFFDEFNFDPYEDIEIQIFDYNYDAIYQDYDSESPLDEGTDGSLDQSDRAEFARTRQDLLVDAYEGRIDTDLTNKKLYPIDMVMDANYPLQVKRAIHTLVNDIRRDHVAIIDTGFTNDPASALDKRQNDVDFNSRYVSIFTQDFIVRDDYTSRDIRVTSPYFLAGRIPQVDTQFGIHYPFVGPRRGTISGYEKLSWNPNTQWKEQLYKNQINYIQSIPQRTQFDSQLTSQKKTSALSNLNNMRVLMQIQRDVEEMGEMYKFEFHHNAIPAYQNKLNNYLQRWQENGACQSIQGQVYASDYDRQQKILRVRVEIQFSSLVERIAIDLVVTK